MVTESRICRRLTITGRVQGVSYRAWFCDLARQLGLQGWVRNRRDGSVEALIYGAPDDVNAMIKAANSGPTLAEVDNVEAEAANFDGPLSFEIYPTE